METTNTGNAGPLQLILFLCILIPAIFFLLTQSNTLKLISRENRLMQPGRVWLQLIPVFGLIWQFFVISRIADSIKKQWQTIDEDSILGISAEAVATAGKSKPTFGIGMAYSQLSVGSILLSYLNQVIKDDGLLLVIGAVALAAMTCWIIYWVQLAGWKRRLKRRAGLVPA